MNNDNDKEKRAEMIDRKTGQTICAIADFHYSDIDHSELFEDKFGEDFGGFTSIWIWIADSAIAFDRALKELKGIGPHGFYTDWLRNYCEAIKRDSVLEDREWARTGDMDEWFKARAVQAIDGGGA